MRPSNQSKIRELLQRFPDGLTASEIASRVGIAGAEHRSLRRTLTGMPDAYIDRWVRHQRGRLLSALRKLANEPQDITSKAYQYALGVLGEFEG